VIGENCEPWSLEGWAGRKKNVCIHCDVSIRVLLGFYRPDIASMVSTFLPIKTLLRQQQTNVDNPQLNKENRYQCLTRPTDLTRIHLDS
jgi:hypothetical protein